MNSLEKKPPINVKSISELHVLLKLPKPLHPLLSLVDYEKTKIDQSVLSNSLLLNFYKVSFRKNYTGKIKYGQSYYDFSEGGLSFISPNQLIAGSNDKYDFTGYSLYIHPDFLRNYQLAKTIKNFGFFSYATNEALHLSAKEKKIIISVFKNIEAELQNNIDDFSQDIMISYMEVLLNYSNRFYKRQFITRKAVHSDLLTRIEGLLNDYFDNNDVLMDGIPTVQYVAERLKLSSGYLSDMLRTITGQNAQQHIHTKMIEKAKEKLSNTDLSISEIAYELGFEHPQSFSKLFKSKTNYSPIEYRKSFN